MLKKYYLQYKDLKNTWPIKTRKEIETTYCLGCKDYTDNFKPQEVQITNKVLEKNQTVLFVDLVNQDF